MKRALTWLLGLALILLLTFLSFLFLGSILLLLTTFTWDYFTQSFLWFAVMWFVVGLMERFTEQLRY